MAKIPDIRKKIREYGENPNIRKKIREYGQNPGY